MGALSWPTMTVSLLCSLQVLADIEVAQSLQAQKVEEEEEVVTHPLDRDYALLCCQLTLLEHTSQEYEVGRSPVPLRHSGDTVMGSQQ